MSVTNLLRRYVLVLVFLALVALPFIPAKAQAQAQPFLSGLDWPVAFAFAPDGRVFFNEKNTGKIRVAQNGVLLETPVATLDVLSQGESGLLGLALDPNFASNHYLYVYFAHRNQSGSDVVTIRRFTEKANLGEDPVDVFNLANPSGRRYHNGGYIKFGPDGKLYVEVGEFQNPQLSQNLNSNAGKILRMNPDGAVPSDNPFPRSLVYAYGIRNAFGLDFDPINGWLIATEAGPDRDEINLIVSGANYGWPDCLGACNNPRWVDPILTLGPPAVTPTGIAYAEPGTFYFGEWSTGDLKRLRLTSTGNLEAVEEVLSIGGILAVERGPDGNIYFSTTDTIYKYDLHPGQTTTFAQSTPTQETTGTVTSAPATTGAPVGTSLSPTVLIVLGVFVVLLGFVVWRRPRRPR